MDGRKNVAGGKDGECGNNYHPVLYICFGRRTTLGSSTTGRSKRVTMGKRLKATKG